jgi:hypothetical protein
MKKYLIGLALLLVVGFSAYYLKNRCEQPNGQQLQQAVLKCYMITLDKASNITKQELCTVLGKDKDCQLFEQDRPAVENIFKNIFKECVENDLGNQNLCIDKLEL